MEGYDITRLAIALLVILIGTVVFLLKINKKHPVIDAKFITRTAIFSAISVILYVVPYLKFAVPFFPSFLEIHFDEVPALIAGFAYGPLSACFVILIKTIVKLPFTTSLCVGEFTDLIYGLVFIVPASLIYRKIRKFKGALLGIGVSTILQLVVSSLFTSFVILNFYMLVMGLPKESILAMCQAINPNVKDLGWTFCFLVALPFNAFKDAIIVAITLLLYKKLHKLIDKIGQEKN